MDRSEVAYPINARPRPVQCGVGLHGTKAVETHLQRECWSLHFYHYAGSLQAWGRTYDFEPGSVSLIPPGCVVKWSFPPHATHYYAHFRNIEGKRPGRVVISLVRSAVSVPAGFGDQFDALVRYFNSGEFVRAGVRLWDLLFQLALPAPPPPGVAQLHPNLQIALAVIRNSPGQKLTVQGLANGMGISRNQVTRLFQKEFQCGAKEYIHRARMGRALNLLAHSTLSVKSIALSLGFTDLSHFNKSVRRETGTSPTLYRQASS